MWRAKSTGGGAGAGLSPAWISAQSRAQAVASRITSRLFSPRPECACSSRVSTACSASTAWLRPARARRIDTASPRRANVTGDAASGLTRVDQAVRRARADAGELVGRRGVEHAALDRGGIPGMALQAERGGAGGV